MKSCEAQWNRTTEAGPTATLATTKECSNPALTDQSAPCGQLYILADSGLGLHCL
nr:MAG TPA: hypothetical protein [Caudoviricetes sp.]